ncbi:hypothetical protein CC1G_03903 [Coprinopsis cinerea okayama7|uniref:DUF6593 domain-containing protein n=1 Tax=Coprinopsis cinerea (strain Okayama-7 / 130 / ATCC MYA-4618 / FGSC 9003) TaxID=240176 RepID=A8NH56_COPC7|nr:hypothetical protein CC1G_03903 [Coprinopsis cinerea okayama7\|eukprot:XP_001833686.2 hypothetical protein CC1G_03903 [Coprinopsis cinerea okayama7\
MTTAPSTTYDLFFTGRDDPRACIVIGEDIKPVYFSFETRERNQLMSPSIKTTVYRNGSEQLCATLDWSPGNHLGSVTVVGTNRHLPMSHFVMPGSSPNARAFVSTADGKRYEWRRLRETPTSYDLYSAANIRIAVFRRYAQATVVGPSHGLFQYTFINDPLLVDALLALCINRWIDLHGL